MASATMADEFYDLVAHHRPPEPPPGVRGGRPRVPHRVAGCYITIARDGALRVEKGLVRKEDVKKVSNGSDEETPSKKEKPYYTLSLFDDLQAFRTYAARFELAKHRDIAFDLMNYLRNTES